MVEQVWETLAQDRVGLALLTQALPAALTQFQTFLLVLIRLSGLMVISPILGQSQFPVTMRVLLTISLALLLTPVIAGLEPAPERVATVSFSPDGGSIASGTPLGAGSLGASLAVPFDQDRDGWLLRDDVPEPLRPAWDVLITRSPEHLPPAVPVTLWRRGLPLAEDWGGLTAQVLRELLLGFSLGLGMTVVLSGLQLAGQMIDQQVGFGLGEVFNPDLGGSGSISGQMMVILGTIALLLFEPGGGHLVMLRTLAETFAVWPVGDLSFATDWTQLLIELVGQSLVLGLRVAAPIVVMLSLVDLTLGFLGHTVPQLNVQAVGYGMRAGVGVLLMALTCSQSSDVLWSMLPDALEAIRGTLLLTSAAATGAPLGPIAE